MGRQIGMNVNIGMSDKERKDWPKLIEFLIGQDNIQIQGEGQKLLKQEDSFFQQLLKKPK